MRGAVVVDILTCITETRLGKLVIVFGRGRRSGARKSYENVLSCAAGATAMLKSHSRRTGRWAAIGASGILAIVRGAGRLWRPINESGVPVRNRRRSDPAVSRTRIA